MVDTSKYEIKRLFKDEGFENGFVVKPLEHAPALGTWTYPTAKEARERGYGKSLRAYRQASFQEGRVQPRRQEPFDVA